MGWCSMQGSEEETSGTKKLSRAAKGVLNSIPPVALGQRSRQFFNDVWSRVNNIGGISRRLAPLAPGACDNGDDDKIPGAGSSPAQCMSGHVAQCECH
jgi:hypothetical protein